MTLGHEPIHECCVDGTHRSAVLSFYSSEYTWHAICFDEIEMKTPSSHQSCTLSVSLLIYFIDPTMSVYSECRHFCSNTDPTFNTLNFGSYYFVFIWMEICFVEFSFSININSIRRMWKLWKERERERKKSWDNFHGIYNIFLASFWLVFDLRDPLETWIQRGERERKVEEINLLKMKKTFFSTMLWCCI